MSLVNKTARCRERKTHPMAPRTYKRDKIGRFAEVAGSSGGGSGSSGESSGGSSGGGTGSAGPTGKLNASDAKGKGVEKMYGVRATGRMVEVKDKDGKKKMVPEYDFSERAKYVDEKLDRWRFNTDSNGKLDPIETKSMYSVVVDGKKDYAPWRKKQQQELMDDLYAKKAAQVPNEGKAIMAGGLGGAGKGFTLDGLGVGPDSPDYFTINPDDIKVEMANRGMIPQLDKKMTLMELSPLAHEEASDMAMLLAERAYGDKKNIVWDFTMSSEGSVVNKRINPMRDADYTDIKGVFVDVTVDKSINQAEGRWQRGLIEYGEGKGEGGRFLPSSATRENLPKGTKYRSKNRETFEAIKGGLDGYIVYDNQDESTVVDSKNARGIGSFDE